jgi:hypothetical protein
MDTPVHVAYIRYKCTQPNIYITMRIIMGGGARGSVVVRGTMLQAGRSRVRFSIRSWDVSIANPSSSTMALGLTQPLTEMSTRNLPGRKGGPARKADNLTAIC